MNAQQFCIEYSNETLSGRITFSKRKVFQFIRKYTYLDPSDFTDESLQRLRFYMVNLYDDGFKYTNREELPAEKIELPEFIIK